MNLLSNKAKTIPIIVTSKTLHWIEDAKKNERIYIRFKVYTHISSKTTKIFSTKIVKMLFFRRNVKIYILVILLTSPPGCRWKLKNDKQTNIVAFRWFIWMHGRNEETNNTQMEHLDKTSRWTIWMHLPDVQTNRTYVAEDETF